MRVLNALVVVLVAGLALQAGLARAQVPPTRFYGELLIDGQAAPVGTEVKVRINDVDCGTALTKEDGHYVVDAAHMATVEGCGVDEQEVVFVVGDHEQVFAQGHGARGVAHALKYQITRARLGRAAGQRGRCCRRRRGPRGPRAGDAEQVPKDAKPTEHAAP